MKIFKLGLALLFTGATVFAQSLPPMSGEDVMKRVDENEVYTTVSFTATMTIDLGHRKLVKELKSVAEGASKGFVEFTNPEDRGTRYLKIDKDLWMYFPEEQDTVKISGHLLKEGMMGSDVSYEDALESDSLADKYTITVVGTELVDDRPCYVLDLVAKVKKVPYDRQKLWVDGERFVALKGEMYAKSGKLLKESSALKVEQYGKRWFVTSMRMEDMLKKSGGTLFEMENLQFDVKLPADQFSLRRLSR